MKEPQDPQLKTNRLAQIAADAVSGLHRADAAGKYGLWILFVVLLLIALAVMLSGELRLEALN